MDTPIRGSFNIKNDNLPISGNFQFSGISVGVNEEQKGLDLTTISTEDLETHIVRTSELLRAMRAEVKRRQPPKD